MILQTARRAMALAALVAGLVGGLAAPANTQQGSIEQIQWPPLQQQQPPQQVPPPGQQPFPPQQQQPQQPPPQPQQPQQLPPQQQQPPQGAPPPQQPPEQVPQGELGSQGDPQPGQPGQPPASGQERDQEVVPDPESGTRIENPVAVFTGLDKITGRIITFDVYIDETVQFGALQVTPRVCHTRPPTEPQETTSFVQIDEITLENEIERIFSGWMFASSPGLNAVEHPIYDVWLINCKTSSDAPSPTAEGQG